MITGRGADTFRIPNMKRYPINQPTGDSTMIIEAMDRDDEPVTLQIIFRSDGTAEVYVDTTGPNGEDGVCLSSVYLDADGIAKLRDALGA